MAPPPRHFSRSAMAISNPTRKNLVGVFFCSRQICSSLFAFACFALLFDGMPHQFTGALPIVGCFVLACHATSVGALTCSFQDALGYIALAWPCPWLGGKVLQPQSKWGLGNRVGGGGFS